MTTNLWDKRKLTKNILLGRFYFIILQAIANNVIPDHNADVFEYKMPRNKSFIDKIVEISLSGFLRWDAQYFIHISTYGYTYENTLAFFPLLPYLVKTLAYPFAGFTCMNILSQLLVIYTIVNIIAFTAAAMALYDLTKELFDDKKAYETVILFSVNPATIFFMAPYTECIFAYFTFNMILNALKLSKDFVNLKYLLLTAFYASLSISTRSNGLLNIGFFIYFWMYAFINDKNEKYVKMILYSVFTLIVGLIICVIPYIAIQYYHYHNFCTKSGLLLNEDLINYGKLNNFVMPGENNSTWCNYKYFPNSYGYVQEKYWNVGFLRYYEFKQIPNFLLAAPIIIISLSGCIKFVKSNCKYLLRLEFLHGLKENERNDVLLPFILHAFVLTIFCILYVHIQVTTRMLCSATPLIYWFALDNVKGKWVLYYFWSFCIIGIIMFSNFLPWT